MAYNTTVITTPTGKKIYYKGSYGDYDKTPDIPVEEEETEAEVPADVVPPTESKKSKVLIFGALIAAALFLFK